MIKKTRRFQSDEGALVRHKATTYTRSTFELPCGELLVEGVLLLWRLPSLVILMAGLGELEPPTSPLSGAFMVLYA
jgi:hypothetical protein